MNTQTTEWFVAVEDFYTDDEDLAFEVAADQCERVFEEVTKALEGRGKITSASFIYFDNDNVGDAHAVYEITVEGFDGDLEENI